MNYQLYIINCNNISFSTLSSFVALFSFQGTKVSARIPQYICDFFEPYIRLWWRWGESNSWPSACKADALPAELHPHIPSRFPDWWALVDSNHRPHAYQACALTGWAKGPCRVSSGFVLRCLQLFQLLLLFLLFLSYFVLTAFAFVI